MIRPLYDYRFGLTEAKKGRVFVFSVYSRSKGHRNWQNLTSLKRQLLLPLGIIC